MSAPIYVAQSALQAALHTVHLVAGRKGLPICSSVLLRASDGLLDASATNLDQYLRASIPATLGGDTLDSSWAGCVPLEPLMSLIDATPGVTIELSWKDYNLAIRPERSGSARIAGWDESEFPGFDENDRLVDLMIPHADLAACKRYVAHACSEDLTRPVLNGVLLRRIRKHLEAVATDGHRLATINMPESRCEDSVVNDLIVPPKAIDLAYRLSAPESTIAVKINSDSIEATLVPIAPLSSIRLYAKTIQGQYPAYKQTIPKASAWTATFDREDLIRSVRRVRAAARHEGDALVLCDWRPGHAELSGKSVSRGSEGRGSLPAVVAGDPSDIGWSANQLLGILSVFEGQEVVCAGNGPHQATVWRDVGEDDARPLLLLMPFKRPAP